MNKCGSSLQQPLDCNDFQPSELTRGTLYVFFSLDLKPVRVQHITSNAFCFVRFPEEAVSLLQSGCMESLLLRSLYTDREFWDSQGGATGLRPLIQMVEQRGKILLQHIRDNKLRLMRDL